MAWKWISELFVYFSLNCSCQNNTSISIYIKLVITPRSLQRNSESPEDTMTHWRVKPFSPYSDLRCVVKSCSTTTAIYENAIATETFLSPVIKWWERVSMQQRLLFRSPYMLNLSRGFPLLYTSCSCPSSSIVVPVNRWAERQEWSSFSTQATGNRRTTCFIGLDRRWHPGGGCSALAFHRAALFIRTC